MFGSEAYSLRKCDVNGPDNSDVSVSIGGVPILLRCLTSVRARRHIYISHEREPPMHIVSWRMQQSAFGAKVPTWKSSRVRTLGYKETFSIIISAQLQRV